MPNVSSGITGDANLVNLKEIPVSQIRNEISFFWYLEKTLFRLFRPFVIR